MQLVLYHGGRLRPTIFFVSVRLMFLFSKLRHYTAVKDNKSVKKDRKITGTEVPFSCEAKLSQFADGTTLICKDTLSLHESMSVLY